jgi:hypothetical protein
MEEFNSLHPDFNVRNENDERNRSSSNIDSRDNKEKTSYYTSTTSSYSPFALVGHSQSNLSNRNPFYPKQISEVVSTSTSSPSPLSNTGTTAASSLPLVKTPLVPFSESTHSLDQNNSIEEKLSNSKSSKKSISLENNFVSSKLHQEISHLTAIDLPFRVLTLVFYKPRNMFSFFFFFLLAYKIW